MPEIPKYSELMMEPPADPVLPFGKHQGKYASQVDVHYLDWLIGLKDLRPKLREELESHLMGRAEWRRMGEEAE